MASCVCSESQELASREVKSGGTTTTCAHLLTASCFCCHVPQVNVPGGPYPAPFADIYRGMAEIGTKGFSALPKHCTTLMGAFFAGGGRVWGGVLQSLPLCHTN